MKIRLTQEAEIEGYDGAFLRYVSSDGKESARGIRDTWFEATATNENGDDYRVFWKLKDDFDIESEHDYEYACDWYRPYMILDDDGKNVIDGIPFTARYEKCDLVYTL